MVARSIVRRSGWCMRLAVAGSSARRLALLRAMRRREVTQRGEAEIVVRHRIGKDRRPYAALAGAPVDPGRRDSHSICRNMIVEQALRHVEQIALANAVGIEACDKILEI